MAEDKRNTLQKDLQAPARKPGGRAALPLPLGSFIGFISGFFAVVLIAALSFDALEGRTAAADKLTQTLELREQLQGVLSTLKDAETGQRGYLLTGLTSYLQPYEDARSRFENQIGQIRLLLLGRPRQLQRLDVLDHYATEKMTELGHTIALKQEGNSAGAMELVRTDRGKLYMDRIRSAINEMENEERAMFDRQRAEWDESKRWTSFIVTGGSGLLLFLIAMSALMAANDFRNKARQNWVRDGQMGLGLRIQGEQDLATLGDRLLAYLASYLGAEVAAFYVVEGNGVFRRYAGYALPPASPDTVRSGDGLLGQAAKENRVLNIRELPQGYLQASSTLGQAQPKELLIVPAADSQGVQAVLELGFFRTTDETDRELLTHISEMMGVAVRASKDRTRLEALLEETQQQAEELQVQQEELKVANEELEEQGSMLRESQLQLQSQQAELEQTNQQLSDQASRLESQTDELLATQRDMAEKTIELERSNQYKSEFLANMSHELRTPLNSTLILANLLADNREGNLSGEQVKYAQTISSAGNDLLNLINDILDLSKIEAGKVELTLRPVGLAATIEGLGRSVLPIAQQKGLAFSTAIEPGTPPHIETDLQRLSQILRNLLSNALKFTAQGEVKLRVYGHDADHVAFAVQDSGIGIAAHQQELIFEAFRQADGSTHRKYGGTGLGLSISRDLAHLLGGRISVQSEPGSGSVFTLILPVAGPSMAESGAALIKAPPIMTALPPPSAPLASPPAEPCADDRESLQGAERLLLIVEDDPRFAAILRDLAHEMDFRCVIAMTAEEGIAAAQRYKPSAVLLDINLPDHSGLGVLDQLKHDPATRHIPVHIVSVADYSQEARELGAIGYALKPVKREQLVEAFERLEAKFTQGLRRVLVVEDDERQRESIRHLLSNDEVQIITVSCAAEALAQLETTALDCIVMDLNLPDLSGYELLEQMAGRGDLAFPPVIVYTGRALNREEEQRLRRYSSSIIIKDARSPERLLDEVTLFLHQVEADLPAESQRLLRLARDRETIFEGRRILVVEDDVRNVFALTSVLERKGAKVEIARNGREAIEAIETLARNDTPAELVLMDIMMPEMDGLTATREIRKQAQWKRLPIIALTAKAMKDDQQKCLAAGANDYIAKPLDVEKLLSLIRIWMPK